MDSLFPITPTPPPRLELARRKLAQLLDAQDDYEYFEVDVEKTYVSAVFIKVPRGTAFKDIPHQLISDAAKKLGRFDWEPDDGVDVGGYRRCDKDGDGYECEDLLERQIAAARAEVVAEELVEMGRRK